jgi:hypothetical protein
MIINIRSISCRYDIESFKKDYSDMFIILFDRYKSRIATDKYEHAIIQVKIKKSQFYELINLIMDLSNTELIIDEDKEIIIYDDYYE